jgi:hypothetical protein
MDAGGLANLVAKAHRNQKHSVLACDKGCMETLPVELLALIGSHLITVEDVQFFGLVSKATQHAYSTQDLIWNGVLREKFGITLSQACTTTNIHFSHSQIQNLERVRFGRGAYPPSAPIQDPTHINDS